MGNSVSLRQLGGATTGKVILSDGSVIKYDEPVTAAELMLDHPQEVVVELNGKRPAPLPADEVLDMKKLYIMLPIKKGKPATLSHQEAKELLTKTNSLLKSKSLLSYTGFLPMFVRICHPIRDHGAPVSVDTNKAYDLGAVSELEGRPEFLTRQTSGKGWKPSLDTIDEKSSKGKPIHWLFSFEAID
ncbi:Multidrug resistance protein ABC transporter family protein [Dorcoceras hygrometricum]|uniref:Multidrug resistance protein ABC transporter family protein n=1 Tax=Dorcoceras hygrometricum TaxID=472368 RepID=A0A2Z7C085_9LAMI|nr:Multidrug resistance protein ABC transporter family protein [Dorcoceras hygrometricum]